jgi:hypothetical protein
MYVPMNQHKVSKRTGKNTVALVGFSSDTRHLAPYEDEDTEIWSLNEAGVKSWMKRWDRWFQLHPPANFTRSNNQNDPHHFDWLKAQTKPIYMQDVYDYIPASVKYPLDEVKAKYGGYFTSTAAFMLALAMLEGFERIEIFGISMGSQTEYHYQRANFEYMIGLARGLGFEVELLPQTPLCKGQLYGYESLEVSFRQQLEYKRIDLENQQKLAEQEALRLTGRFTELDDLLRTRPTVAQMEERHNELANNLNQAAANSNFLMGQVAGLNTAIDFYDEHLEQTGVGHAQESQSESHRST